MKDSKTLRSVANDLNRYIILASLAVFLLFLASNLFIYKHYKQHLVESDQRDLQSALLIYTTNLVAQIGLVASSVEFLEFIRSGDVTRERKKRDFYDLMGRMSKQNISGWVIEDKKNSTIFSFGATNNNIIKFPLCYIGDTINSYYGTCVATLFIYISNDELYKSLRIINDRILLCSDCEPAHQIKDLGNETYKIDLEIKTGFRMKSKFDELYFIALEVTSFIGILFVAIWVRSRVRTVLNRNIIDPIIGISNFNCGLKISDSTVEEIVQMRHRRDLLQAKTLAEEKQNRWLANEIHDEFGSQLVTLKWSIELLDKHNTPANLALALSNIDGLIKLTNNFIAALRPEDLETLGLQRALIQIINVWEVRNRKCEYTYKFNIKEDCIPEGVGHAVYRICQESLTNIFKHSDATNAGINLSTQKDPDNNEFILLIIKDNGKGFDVSTSHNLGGHGINSMRDRAISLAGSFRLQSSPSSGTLIEVKMPLTCPSA